MPSLEIVCIGQLEPTDFLHLPFAVKAESQLISHRSPKPLFRPDFDAIQGCIYHLLDERKVTAYLLLKMDWFGEDEVLDGNVEFRSEYMASAKKMLEELLEASPVGQVLFTTDYQFGPEGAQRHGPLSLVKFWQMHDAGRIRMNALYWLES